MGNRLSKIVTRTGDDGTTGLADGTRVPKDCARITSLGSIDELSSHLGVLLAEVLPSDIRSEMIQIQQDLFDLGAALALPGSSLDSEKLIRLDKAIASYNAGLPPLKEFILPGGTRASSLCHVARCVTRRAERDLLHLIRSENENREGLRYLNRLSDLLFIVARVLNRTGGNTEILWMHQKT
ncbi:MAG: cob(I)yrinic acid a,c-diamide adenosyltransferase [Pseudomonadota bacterium]